MNSAQPDYTIGVSNSAQALTEKTSLCNYIVITKLGIHWGEDEFVFLNFELEFMSFSKTCEFQNSLGQNNAIRIPNPHNLSLHFYHPPSFVRSVRNYIVITKHGEVKKGRYSFATLGCSLNF